VNASGLVTLSAAANHLTGWNAFDWFFHILFAILGWIAVAAPVFVMHRHMIEGRDPKTIAADLTKAFDTYCAAAGKK